MIPRIATVESLLRDECGWRKAARAAATFDQRRDTAPRRERDLFSTVQLKATIQRAARASFPRAALAVALFRAGRGIHEREYAQFGAREYAGAFCSGAFFPMHFRIHSPGIQKFSKEMEKRCARNPMEFLLAFFFAFHS